MSYNTVAGFSKGKRPRWDVEGGFRFQQDGDGHPDIVTLEETKRRFQKFVEGR
ncbi:hypothetical protein ACLI4Q_05940 [Natrialbaceae archaeon A-CW1-1]